MDLENIPNEQIYTGPEREPPLFSSFDQFLKQAHLQQPVVVTELVEICQGLLYRLRYRLTYSELAEAAQQMVLHNEQHITTDDWLLIDEQGNAMPLVTPELRQQDPARAQMIEELVSLSTKQYDIKPQDFD